MTTTDQLLELVMNDPEMERMTRPETETEKGCASITIQLSKGVIKVRHGSDNSILFNSKVKEGTWNSIWKAIIDGGITR
jgi:hypothetical protein